MEKDKKKYDTGTVVTLSILWVIITILCGIMLYYSFRKDDIEPNKKDNTQENINIETDNQDID